MTISGSLSKHRGAVAQKQGDVLTNRGKILINLLLVGHIGSGKSTVSGHLLSHCGSLDKDWVGKLEEDTKKMGKGTFKYAWVMDKLRFEKERGINVDSNLWKLTMEDRIFTLIDAPGDKNFTHSLVSGVSQSDCALLVVSAVPGEEIFTEEGQTYEHALLCWAFGVKQLIICINKMDVVRYEQSHFEATQQRISKLLKEIGFKPTEMQFIPISGFSGDNITEPSKRMSWYKGQCLSDSLSNFQPSLKLPNRPLRITLRNVYNIGDVGVVGIGRVEAGKLLPGQLVKVAPSSFVAQISEFYYPEKNEEISDQLSEAYPGENVALNFGSVGEDIIKVGSVCGDFQDKPPSEVEEITANLVIVNHPGVKVGYCPTFYCGTAAVPCEFIELVSKNDKRTWRKIEDKPKSVKTGDAVVVRLRPQKPLCVETFNECKALSTLVFRECDHIAGVGAVTKVVKKQPSLPSQSV